MEALNGERTEASLDPAMSVPLEASLGLDSILKVLITCQNQAWFYNPSQNARAQVRS